MAGYRKLGLSTDQRRAMLRSLVTSFLKHGRIETTETRAKEARSIAEKMITLAKRGDLHARRQVLAFVTEETVVTKLFDEIAPQYAERNGLKRFVKLLKNKRAYSEELTIQELDMLYKRAHANQDFQLTKKYAEQALSQFAEEIDETTYTGFRNREQILFYYVSALVNQALIAETSGEFTLAENFVRQAIQYEEERSKYPNKPSLGFGDLDEI